MFRISQFMHELARAEADLASGLADLVAEVRDELVGQSEA